MFDHLICFTFSHSLTLKICTLTLLATPRLVDSQLVTHRLIESQHAASKLLD